MNTKAYKTKSEIIEQKMPRINGNNQYKSKTVIALDGGYSAVKGISPNKVFTFPSYAKLAPAGLEIIGKARPDDLQLRYDDTGEVWVVGRTAENLMDQSDIASTTDASIYTRYRYDSPIFKAIMLTGLLLGLIGTKQADEIYLQTGLPATYKEKDEGKIKRALTGTYHLSLKVGNNDWASFRFDLPEDHIDVMEQPQGTLCAAIYTNNGIAAEGRKVLQSKGTIILDIGFGTEDIFSIRSGFKNNHQTYSDTGMKAVFESVINRIKEADKENEVDIKVFELQSYLESGILSYFDQDTFATKDIEFGDTLRQANEALCEKSIRRLMQEYNNLSGYEYLIVTGGTGQSRFEQIQKMLGGIRSLKILPGNINTPDLSFSYSNVYGYYMHRYMNLMSEMKKQGYVEEES